ncbi:MAG: rhomboid family intramembrane serine protease [Planctomycetota bacterium]
MFQARSRRAIRDCALVLQSAGIPHTVVADGRGAQLVVERRYADAARAELVDYGEENHDWPPSAVAAPPRKTWGAAGALVYGFVIVVVFWLQRAQPFGLDWDPVGVMHAGAARSGEWWRPWTALTMHVDANHLISNLVFGAVFAVVASMSLGSGVVWLGTVLAGALGNAIETFIVDASHRGVGASTALFGTLGLMTAAEWARRGTETSPWVRRVAPLFGGAVLFGWLGGGAGSPRVDVLAHALGFAVGAVLGLGVARAKLAQRLGPRGQMLFCAIAILAVAAAWALGFAATGVPR